MTREELLGFAAEIQVDIRLSPVRQLFTEQELARMVAGLKSTFERDRNASAQAMLNHWRAGPNGGRTGPLLWFQRIALGNSGVSTTSDHSLYANENPGPLNTLWDRLTPMEGCILRPLPKFAYLQAVLPSVIGKTVLEIGSACGFWPLKFMELGASFASGIEVVQDLVEQARHAVAINGREEDVHIVHGDAYLDPSVPKHDVVFMSEVLIHSIFPFFSLLRALNLSRQWLVLDDFFSREESAPAALRLFRDARTGKVSWTGFAMTESLLLQFLYAYGVRPERVTRYRDPMGNHTVVVIDTRELLESRQQLIGHDSLFSSLQASMEHRAFEQSLSVRAAQGRQPPRQLLDD